MFRTRFGSSTNDNAGLYNKGGVSIKRSTPAEVASASTDAAAVSIKPWKRIAISVIAVIAMVIIALFSLSGCGSSNTKASSSSGSSSSSSAEPVSTMPLDDYSWEELSEISEEIAKAPNEGAAIEVAKKYKLTTEDGRLDGTQAKSVTLSDGTQTTVQIAGFWHDDKADGGKAGITFIFGDCISKREMNPSDTNAGGWEKSRMRSYLDSEGLDLLPDDLRQKIVSVKKLTNNVGGETKSTSSVTPTSDRLWLFSQTELSGTIRLNSNYAYHAAYEDVLNAQGSQYKLFRDTNVRQGCNDILVKKLSAPSGWWERSPIWAHSDGFGYVDWQGDPDNSGYGSYGVVPGFCI